MITHLIRSQPEPNDVTLVAASFTPTGLDHDPIVRLVPQALIAAEELTLSFAGLHLTGTQDAGYTLTRATGFPAWAILNDPDNADHALALVKEFDWVRKYAKTNPGRVRKRIDQLCEQLESTVAHFVPTFLEETARIYGEVGNQNQAKQLFRIARETERRHGLEIDNNRHLQVFQEFATLGLVGSKELKIEATDVSNRMAPEAAYQYFKKLNLARAHSGFAMFSNTLTELRKLGKAAGIKPQQVAVDFLVDYLPTRGFYRTGRVDLEKLIPAMKAAYQQDKSIAGILLSTCPQAWDASAYVDALHATGILTELTANPVDGAQWLVELFHAHPDCSFFATSNLHLLSLIEACQVELSKQTIIYSGHYRGNPDYLNALVGAGTTVKVRADRSSTSGQIDVVYWCESGLRDLDHLMADPDFRELLIRSLHSEDFINHISKLVSFTHTRLLASLWLDNFAARIQRATGCHQWQLWLRETAGYLTNPIFTQLNPSAMKTIVRFDPVEELAERLRRGTFAEYTWPTLENCVLEATKSSRSYVRFYPSFPHICVASGTEIHVLSGTTQQAFSIPVKIRLDQVFVAGENELLLIHDVGYDTNGSCLWLSSLSQFPLPNRKEKLGDRRGYTQTIDGVVHVGTTPLAPGKPVASPLYGHVIGTGPYYIDPDYRGQRHNPVWPPPPATFYDEDGEDDRRVLVKKSADKKHTSMSMADMQAALVQNMLPGVEVSGLDFSAVPAHARIRLDTSHYIPAVAATMDSPLGTYNGVHCGFSFEPWGEAAINGEYIWVSPLGSFTKPLRGFRVLRRPGGGYWLYRYNEIYDFDSCAPISESLDANGEKLPLSKIPESGLHQLKVRNEIASTNLRNCTYEQAQLLFHTPNTIAAFVDNDPVLTTAVHGIIAEITHLINRMTA